MARAKKDDIAIVVSESFKEYSRYFDPLDGNSMESVDTLDEYSIIEVSKDETEEKRISQEIFDNISGFTDTVDEATKCVELLVKTSNYDKNLESWFHEVVLHYLALKNHVGEVKFYDILHQYHDKSENHVQEATEKFEYSHKLVDKGIVSEDFGVLLKEKPRVDWHDLKNVPEDSLSEQSEFVDNNLYMTKKIRQFHERSNEAETDDTNKQLLINQLTEKGVICEDFGRMLSDNPQITDKISAGMSKQRLSELSDHIDPNPDMRKIFSDFYNSLVPPLPKENYFEGHIVLDHFIDS